MEALGETYKPDRLIWDDAYSIYKILTDNYHIFELEEKQLRMVENMIGLEVFTIEKP